MAFDDKYFTSMDTTSYFTENSNTEIYNAASGLTLGEASKFGQTPLAAVNVTANHGLPSIMLGLMAPQRGQRGDATLSADRMSKLQEKAVSELLAVNKMNLAMHAPIVDIMGIGDSPRGGAGMSAQRRSENLKLLKMNLDQTDRIADKAGLKEVPVNIHVSNSIGDINTKFDSGFKDNDDNVVWGTKDYMVDRDTGQVMPINSDFQWMSLTEGSKKNYKLVKNTTTKDGSMALFEISPEVNIRMANSTALNEQRKKIAETQATINNLLQSGTSANDPIIQDLQVTINTAKSKIQHLESPYFGTGDSKQQFVKIKDMSNKIVPKQIAELAMHSLKNTKTHPIVAVENEPAWQLGSRPELLIDWVEKGRKEFADKLIKKEGYNRKAAEDKAKELIGVTLDTGHLNTLKSQINPDTNKPWTDKELREQVKKMAVTGAKLVHIADNIGEFGQDTHLMIGRGNTENEEFLKILKENGFKGQAQFEAFTTETEFDKLGQQASLMGLGAPMYSSTPVPRFQDVGTNFSMYNMRHASYGHQLPQLHFSRWGGPFAGLQSTFGAKPQGSRDQFSGTPTE